MIDTHDVVLRYLRSRPGDISGKEVDAISIAGSSRNVIADHCSATWSVDEALSPSGAIADVTVQWCLIAEGLDNVEIAQRIGVSKVTVQNHTSSIYSKLGVSTRAKAILYAIQYGLVEPGI